MSTSSDSLARRYGAPTRGRRTAVVVVAGVVALTFLGWLGWAMLFHADPAVSSRELGHEVLDEHRATIRVQIQYGDEPVEATCKARAIAHDKTPVGDARFEPDPEAGRVHEIEIRTERRATTVEWLGCTTEGQPRPR